MKNLKKFLKMFVLFFGGSYLRHALKRYRQVVIKNHFSYYMEHLACNYNHDFINEHAFQIAYKNAMALDPSPGYPERLWDKDQFGAWILYVNLHFTRHAL